jgi:hypothetical protein
MAKSAVPGGVLSGKGLSLVRLNAAIRVSGFGFYSDRACEDAATFWPQRVQVVGYRRGMVALQLIHIQ